MDGKGLRELSEWAMSAGAVVVTSPSIVSVRSSAGSYRLALGVGSLISEVEPPAPHYVLSSSDWVDGCRAGSVEPYYRSLGGSGATLRGVAVALDISDPVAMMLNGQRVEAEVPEAGLSEVSWTLVLDVGGQQRGLVGLSGGEYVLAAVGGRARELLEYMLKLYTSCGRST